MSLDFGRPRIDRENVIPRPGVGANALVTEFAPVGACTYYRNGGSRHEISKETRNYGLSVSAQHFRVFPLKQSLLPADPADRHLENNKTLFARAR
jgi:hypothetical protein